MIKITGDMLSKGLERIGMQKQELAEILNVNPTAVSNWIIRGVPNSKTSQVLKVLHLEEEDDDKSLSTKHSDNIDIPKLRNITVSAGFGFDTEGVDESIYDGTLTVDTKDVVTGSRNTKSLVAVRVDGRSMSPTLNNNEWIVMDTSKTSYIGDNLYVVNYGGNLLVKRLQYDPSTNSIDIISDNPSYQNYKVNLNEDQQYFQIVGIASIILISC